MMMMMVMMVSNDDGIPKLNVLVMLVIIARHEKWQVLHCGC